ncbi:MAG: helix-turn-helix domain-containing protein [Fimbriimonadaceae bacterium]|nr:helix-turn-helix domain-containing protein [Fimbriimonadaceae bacterium]
MNDTFERQDTRDREILTPSEAADHLRIGRTKIYELLGSKAIRSKRIGKSYRILRSDLDKYLETQ